MFLYHFFVRCNKLNAKYLTSNLIYHTKIKHVTFDLYFVHECVKENMLWMHVIFRVNLEELISS